MNLNYHQKNASLWKFLIQISQEVDIIRISWLKLPSRNSKGRFTRQNMLVGEKPSASGTIMSIFSVFFIPSDKSILFLFCSMNPTESIFSVLWLYPAGHANSSNQSGILIAQESTEDTLQRLKLIGLNSESRINYILAISFT